MVINIIKFVRKYKEEIIGILAILTVLVIGILIR